MFGRKNLFTSIKKQPVRNLKVKSNPNVNYPNASDGSELETFFGFGYPMDTKPIYLTLDEVAKIYSSTSKLKKVIEQDYGQQVSNVISSKDSRQNAVMKLVTYCALNDVEIFIDPPKKNKKLTRVYLGYYVLNKGKKIMWQMNAQ